MLRYHADSTFSGKIIHIVLRNNDKPIVQIAVYRPVSRG